MRTELEQKDRDLALEINNTEAEENEALHDCECCFTSTTFEELSACNDGGHLSAFNVLDMPSMKPSLGKDGNEISTLIVVH